MMNDTYAWSWFVPDAKGVVRLICNNIYARDAVGNFCLDIYQLCQQNNIPIVMYASSYHKEQHAFIRDEQCVAQDTQPDDTLLYFHSIEDPHLPMIAALTARKKIAYFHGITNPAFFRDSNPGLSKSCEQGFQQLNLLTTFDVFAANSFASAMLMNKHAPSIDPWSVAIIPPRLMPTKKVEQVTTGAHHKAINTTFLYVGRIKSHKKIEDIIVLFAHYLKKDPTAALWIVGGQDDPRYKQQLAAIAADYLGADQEKIKWFGLVSDTELEQLYAEATVYLSMSEDEGFCVPVLEAMLAGLPVFAYGIPAVKEVMGGAGVYFSHKDFPLLATWFYDILTNATRVQTIIQSEWQHAKNMLQTMDGRMILQLFES
jgi:glycosyltransferase involved in cell wall biosynthesis